MGCFLSETSKQLEGVEQLKNRRKDGRGYFLSTLHVYANLKPDTENRSIKSNDLPSQPKGHLYRTIAQRLRKIPCGDRNVPTIPNKNYRFVTENFVLQC